MLIMMQHRVVIDHCTDGTVLKLQRDRDIVHDCYADRAPFNLVFRNRKIYCRYPGDLQAFD